MLINQKLQKNLDKSYEINYLNIKEFIRFYTFLCDFV